jgi:hypothetical protein
MPRFPRLNALLHTAGRAAGRAAVSTGVFVAQHVDVEEVARIVVTAGLSGGNPAAIGRAVSGAVLADLPALVKAPEHKAAAADVVRAIQSVAYLVALAQVKAATATVAP